jgi:GDP-4-dehydro-6-deoxy-D-mannose reductase
MRALITGSLGFVGQHLIAELEENNYLVSGVDLMDGYNTACVDLTDEKAVSDCIRAMQPDIVFHLAALASIPISWEKPRLTYDLNFIGTINLLEAIRKEQKNCRVLIVGSSYQYAAVNTQEPITEDSLLDIGSPYAASKKAQEEIAILYTKACSMNICFTRSFNHIGPGQRLGFLVSDLCSGIVAVEKEKAPHLNVGNLEAIRDYTDVRDVVRAYRLLGERGEKGEVYNVGSGVGYKVREILDRLLGMAERDIPIQTDPRRMRPSEMPVQICNNQKLRTCTGWMPKMILDQTLRDSLEYYRRLC